WPAVEVISPTLKFAAALPKQGRDLEAVLVNLIDGRSVASDERPSGSSAAQGCDEVAPSHEILPVEDKAYQKAALCSTASSCEQSQQGSPYSITSSARTINAIGT